MTREPSSPLSRRAFLGTTAFGAAAAAVPGLRPSRRTSELPEIRAVTGPPGHHWFGYYDKLQFSPDDRFLLGMRTTFEHRTPRADDTLTLGLVDLDDDDAWRSIGTTTAWCWQQGCMLQWIPGSRRRVLWNDREGDRYVARILDLDAAGGAGDAESAEPRTLSHPVYAVAPDGRHAVGADFRRIQALRPGYGYVGIPDPHADELVPRDSGIYTLDLETGEARTVLTLAEIAALGPRRPDMDGAKHYVNHLLVSPDSQRFVFLHRWRPDGGRKGFRTRMFTAALDGTDVRLIDPSGTTSHFIWRDPGHIAAWSKPTADTPRGFHLFEDRAGGAVTPIGPGRMVRDGHLSYVPPDPGGAWGAGEWIVNDTYPDARRRLQRSYLFHVPSGRTVPLGAFHAPKAYRGEWRCDTHPRLSRDGTRVVIDSPHGGDGRQMWLIEVGEILAGAG